MSSGEHRTVPKTLIAIVALGAAIRLWLVFTAAGINSDAYDFALTTERMARSGIASGMRGDFFWPYYPLNRRLVTYPLLGSLVYRVTGDAVLSLRLVSALAGILLIPVVYAIVKELFEDETAALLSAGLIAFHPEFAVASASVYREALMACLAALSFLFLLRALRSPCRAHLWSVGTGLLLFAAFVNRPEGLLCVAAAVIVLLLARTVPGRKRLWCGVAMIAVFCMLEIPYVWWMKQQTGYWLPNQYLLERKIRQWPAIDAAFLQDRARRVEEDAR